MSKQELQLIFVLCLILLAEACQPSPGRVCTNRGSRKRGIPDPSDPAHLEGVPEYPRAPRGQPGMVSILQRAVQLLVKKTLYQSSKRVFQIYR